MNDYKTEMGKRLKEKRKLHHLTQEQMAEKLNISLKHYGSVERGLSGLSLENLIEVCTILGTDLNYLVTGTPETDDMTFNRIRELYLSCSPAKRLELLEIIEKIVHF